jgi:hypothetical protein
MERRHEPLRSRHGRRVETGAGADRAAGASGIQLLQIAIGMRNVV